MQAMLAGAHAPLSVGILLGSRAGGQGGELRVKCLPLPLIEHDPSMWC